MSDEVRIVAGGASDVQRLAPLWAAMHAHHSTMEAEVGRTRPVEDSWLRRRAQYEHWFAERNAILLLAQRDDRPDPVGYAMLTIGPGPATWDLGERVGELESLSVMADERGRGVGQALLSAARAAARELGAERLFVGVAHANAGALRFYEREGFRPFYALLMD
jgi:ribosomal protein S18 acetylase RimI-like enzyme